MTNRSSSCIFGCEHETTKSHRLSAPGVRCAGQDEAAALREARAVTVAAGSRCLALGCHQSAARLRELANGMAADAHVWDLKAAVCQELAPGPLQDAASRLVETWTGSFAELRSAAQGALRRGQLTAAS